MKKRQRQQRALAKQRAAAAVELSAVKNRLAEALKLLSSLREKGVKVVAFNRYQVLCDRDCETTRWTATVLADDTPKRDAPGRFYVADMQVSHELLAWTHPDDVSKMLAEFARNARRELTDAVLEGL